MSGGDETRPWRVELCVQVCGDDADAARELAARVERSIRRVGGRRVSVFSDHEGPQDGGDDGDQTHG